MKNLNTTFFWFILSMLVLLIPLAAGAQSISNQIFSLTWSPDGTLIASGHRDGIVKIWDAITGTLLTTFQIPDPFNPSYFLESIYHLEWSPDGNHIAIGEVWSEGPIGFLHIIDATTGSLRSTTQTQDAISDLSWSPDSTRIAAIAFSISLLNYPYALLVVDANTGAQLLRLDSPDLQGISSVDWSPDGSRIATGGSLNNLVQIWDTNSGALLTTFQGHTDNVWEVRWNSSGTRLATLGGDFTLRIWDASTGQNLQTFPLSLSAPVQIAWKPNSDQLALVFDTSIQIIDTVTGQTINTLPGGGVAAWSPDGTRMVTVLNSEVTIVDATTGNPIPTATPTLGATDTPTPSDTPIFTPTNAPSRRM